MRLNLPDTDILLSESQGGHAASRSVVLESKSAPHLTYHLLLPRERHPEERILVSVHGVSRNAEEHIELLRPLAERYGVLLVAPVFAADRFRDFQRLGRKGRGPRADLALIRVLNELNIATGWDTSKIDMFGFSGGAQFAHRFALAHPQRVRRLALGAAGWYTMPDDTLRYPYGSGDVSGLDAVRLNAVAAARLPTLVLVGERDDRDDDEELNRSQIVCRQPGRYPPAKGTNLDPGHEYLRRGQGRAGTGVTGDPAGCCSFVSRRGDRGWPGGTCIQALLCGARADEAADAI